ncbi:MAG: ECF transporter S component, partial [Oscillospiraceae bacterium]
MQKKFSLQDVVLVGVMAAIVFVLTYFIKIDIPTPVGPTMLKVANGFCLLAGILLGGLKGGLAAGLGSMLYD